MMKSLFTIIRITLGLGLFYYILSTYGDLTSLATLFANWWVLLVIFLLPISGALIEAYRLKLLLRTQGFDLSIIRLYQLVAVGTFFNFAIPGGTGGDVVKLYYLAAEKRGKTLEMATSLFVDRALALFSWLIVILGLSLINLRLILSINALKVMVFGVIILLLLLLFVFVMSSSDYLRKLKLHQYLVNRVPFHKHLKRISDALYTFHNYPKTLFYAILVSMLGHLSLAIMYMTVGAILLPQSPLILTSLLAFLGMLANVLPLTPGGIGVGEAAFESLFRLVGYSGGAFLIVSWRIGMLPISALGGILYMKGVRKNTVNSDAEIMVSSKK